jgi:hypothetical protein
MSWLPGRKPAWANLQEKEWEFETTEYNPICGRRKRGAKTGSNALEKVAGSC